MMRASHEFSQLICDLTADATCLFMRMRMLCMLPVYLCGCGYCRCYLFNADADAVYATCLFMRMRVLQMLPV
jgi:hypothetical protein